MMRILYGINTNGQGHINRSRNLINQFREDGHEVDILFSGPKPPRYAYSMSSKKMVLPGLTMVYQNNLVNVPKTIYNGIDMFFNIFDVVRQVQPSLKKQKYDFIITDQEPYCPIFGARESIPTIAIDHQHSLIHNAAFNPNKHLMDKISAIVAVYMNVRHKDYAIALDYVEKPILHRKNILFPLVKKVDLPISPNGKEEDFIIAYFNKSSLDKVTDVLSKFPDTRFKIYGFNKRLKHKNMEFFLTSRKAFLNDLLKAKGVISSAGFSLTWECIQIDKPMYLIPQEFQYEQFVNACRLERLNYALYSLVLEKEMLSKFISEFIPNFKNRRSQLPIYPVSKLTNRVYHLLENWF